MNASAEVEFDQEVLHRFREGDQAAFRLLYQHYAQRVVLFVRSRCPFEADDLIQQTWLKAWSSRLKFRGGCFGAWLITIARNTIYDHLRKMRPESLPEGVSFASDSMTAALRLEYEEDLRQLRECSQQLAPGIQDMVSAFYTGVSGEEIAAQQQIERSTVYTRVHRALAKLRQCMEGKQR